MSKRGQLSWVAIAWGSVFQGHHGQRRLTRQSLGRSLEGCVSVKKDLASSGPAWRGEVGLGFSEGESRLGSPVLLAGYTAFRRMSPQGISVGVSGVILLRMRSLSVPGVLISR